ncbi:MAG: Smr/MutS family protein [Candidatus Andeanibacterium colombiense]|uniref:Smr/MutS family protein n=1 Tax=Candidatus Andeanibacterium colombiense TaxID=3121345 RepID=A0AAJ5X9B2_9SPHN|nr:MAG: Smr/MutS family protein [Sphingomonadaceae bacterium]
MPESAFTGPRGLSPEEKALWQRLAKTVVPLARKDPPLKGEVASRSDDGGVSPPAKSTTPPPPLRGGPPPPKGEDRKPPPQFALRHGLDSTWERRLKGAKLDPDFTLDLHGYTLDAAHSRLDGGLAQAKAMGARLVLVVTGKPRPVDAADRGNRRGAIRAKILDWLAAGPHASDIAAIRGAHRRHGGEGAIYIVLKRARL